MTSILVTPASSNPPPRRQVLSPSTANRVMLVNTTSNAVSGLHLRVLLPGQTVTVSDEGRGAEVLSVNEPARHPRGLWHFVRESFSELLHPYPKRNRDVRRSLDDRLLEDLGRMNIAAERAKHPARGRTNPR